MERSVYDRKIQDLVDLARITGCEWDAGNRGKNSRRSVSDREAERVFFGVPLLILIDGSHRETEPRLHALGQTVASRLLHVTFTLRGAATSIRVISARDMRRKERAFWGTRDSADNLDWSRAQAVRLANPSRPPGRFHCACPGICWLAFASPPMPATCLISR